MSHQYYVYIVANNADSVIYTGVTNNLVKRIYEHKSKSISGFTSRYNVNKLVFYEVCNSVEVAIMREKQIKSWKRERKNKLVSSINSEWKDLYDEL